MSPPASLLHTISESAWQDQVLELACLLGWRTLHLRPASTGRGWRTPVQGDGVGFPDCCLMVRGARLVAAELKAERGRLRPEQATWLIALEEAGAETYTWRPSQWEEVVDVLQRREP